MKKNIFKKLLFLAVLGIAGVSAVGLTSCGSNGQTVKVGVCGASNDHWKAVQYVLDQENAGIQIELVEFSAYNLPNEALQNKDIDLNAFQHKAYLQKEISQNNFELSIIGDTFIAPLTLYSKKYTSLDAIKTAAGTNGTNSVNANALKFAIPSDGTNLSRGIKLLETAGLIEVDPKAGYTPELKDITKYVYNVEVVPQTANTLPQTLDDYSGATINGTYAIPTGLVPSKDGLIVEKQDESGSNPYVNIIVARTADKDNETYKKIVAAFQTQIVAEYILGKFNETFFPSFDYKTVDANQIQKTVKLVDDAIKW